MNVVRAMTDSEKNDAMTIRKAVFIEEQHVPAHLEIDEYEIDADHFVLYDGDRPVGAGRMRTVDGKAKAERICILNGWRGKGAGKTIMHALERRAKELQLAKIKLNSQCQAIPFYEKLGYEVVSEEFLDAGIPHKTMEKSL